MVWTQRRSGTEPLDAFSLSLDRLVDARPENVFLAKFSYYFTP